MTGDLLTYQVGIAMHHEQATPHLTAHGGVACSDANIEDLVTSSNSDLRNHLGTDRQEMAGDDRIVADGPRSLQGVAGLIGHDFPVCPTFRTPRRCGAEGAKRS